MNKKKLLIILVVLLTVMNCAFIAFHFFGSQRGPRDIGKHKQEFVIRELNLDKKQQADYRKLVQKHRTSINSLRKKQAEIKTALYQTIGEKDKESVRADYLERLSLINDEIEFTNLEHFDDIRLLCKTDQIGKFVQFRSNLKSFFDPPRPPKRK